MSMMVQSGRFGGTPPATDPDFSSVVLLMHFDGADGSTTFVDHSSSAKTLTPAGNAQIDTAQSQFGGSSGLFDGTNDNVTAADSADWHFGSGTSPFTIELFVRHTTKNNTTSYVSQWANGWALYIETGQLKFRAINDSGGAILDLAYTWAPTLGQWYHVCAERDSSGKMRLYIDGVMVASHASSFNVTLRDSTSGLAVGAIGTSGSFPTFDFNGHIDELRITKGVARYATDTSFTVPTAPFPDS